MAEQADILKYGDDAKRYGEKALGYPDADAYARGSKSYILVIFAGGYNTYGADISREINDIKIGRWYPHTKDFEKTADFINSKNKVIVKDKDGFIGAFLTFKGKISKVVFIGHGSSTSLGLSGDSSSFFSEEFNAGAISAYQQVIDDKIKPLFTEDASFEILSCNAGAGKAFVTAIAKGFGITVKAFNQELAWCVTYDEAKIRVTHTGKIAPLSEVKAEKAKLGRDPDETNAIWHAGTSSLVFPVIITP